MHGITDDIAAQWLKALWDRWSGSTSKKQDTYYKKGKETTKRNRELEDENLRLKHDADKHALQMKKR